MVFVLRFDLPRLFKYGPFWTRFGTNCPIVRHLTGKKFKMQIIDKFFTDQIKFYDLPEWCWQVLVGREITQLQSDSETKNKSCTKLKSSHTPNSFSHLLIKKNCETFEAKPKVTQYTVSLAPVIIAFWTLEPNRESIRLKIQYLICECEPFTTIRIKVFGEQFSHNWLTCTAKSYKNFEIYLNFIA